MNKYCRRCHQWVMAKEIIGAWRKTANGASRLMYICPICHKTVGS